jgi:cyclophilin family peptidyl-prolyl cis-trans isomerase/HEAT repeat protein
MRRVRILLVLAIAAAGIVWAQTPSGAGAPQQIFLLRAFDAWFLPLPTAVTMLEVPLPTVRAQAVRVMASNPDTGRRRLLGAYVIDRNPVVRLQVMLAAGRLGPEGLELALRGFDDSTALVRQGAVWAACHGGPEAWQPVAERLAKEGDTAVLETLLGNLWRLDGAPWIDGAARFADHSDPRLRRAAAFSLSRTGEPSARPAQRSLAADSEPVIRATALRGFARGALVDKDVEVLLPALEDEDWRVRAAACQVLAAQDGLEVPPQASRAVAGDFSAPQPHLAAAAIAAAGNSAEVGSTEELLALVNGSDPWLAAQALAALAERDAQEAARGIAETWVESSEVWRRRAAARVAAAVGFEIEEGAASDELPGVRLAWLESLSEEQALVRRERLGKVVAEDTDPAARAQALSLLRAAGAAPDVDELLGLYSSWVDDVMPDARAEALIAAMAASEGDDEFESILTMGLADSDPAVRAMVVNGARGLGREARLPAREPRHGGRWYEDLLQWVDEPRWLDVATDRGTFRISLDLATAPITAREIWELAEDGFYDELGFHRVVPNFVIQGGDPRGDGWGGPGFVIPDEPSLVPFDSWRVGIATSGPETGGCQLFVTLLPADHLTGHYTNLGEVTDGRDVLTEIRVGDRIRTIRTVTGAEPPPLAPRAEGQTETRPVKR